MIFAKGVLWAPLAGEAPPARLGACAAARRLTPPHPPTPSLPPHPAPPICKHTQDEGFSAEIIDRFFRPFLGGIFFDTRLRTSSRLFAFVMRMLATGSNCLPARGIGAVAEQLAGRLAPGSLVLGEGAA